MDLGGVDGCAHQVVLLKWTKDRPFWECPDDIDVAMLADVMAALYRFLPEEESIPIFQQCVEPERSEAVKICAVKACLTLIVDVSSLSTYLVGRFDGDTVSGLEAPVAAIHGPLEGEAQGPSEPHLLRASAV